MVTLRCTKRLLSRLPSPPQEASDPPTTALGDWYADLLFTRPHRLIIFVNERSLLSLLVAARDLPALTARFRSAAASLLERIGVPHSELAAEIQGMNEIVFARTVNRSVLGSMNELKFQCSWMLEEMGSDDLEAIALKLADVPCSAVKHWHPRRAALELFGVERTV